MCGPGLKGFIQTTLHILLPTLQGIVKLCANNHGWITQLAFQAQVQGPKVSGCPLAFACKMSVKLTSINQEQTQNNHKRCHNDYMIHNTTTRTKLLLTKSNKKEQK